MNKPNDGRHTLPLSSEAALSAELTDNSKLTLFAEELAVGKEAAETGRVRVSKQTHMRDIDIDESLSSLAAIVRQGRPRDPYAYPFALL